MIQVIRVIQVIRWKPNPVFSVGHQRARMGVGQDEGPCFGFKKKTVVMSCIGLCCLALVVWTIFITSKEPVVEGGKEKNATTQENKTVLCPVSSLMSLDMFSFAVTNKTVTEKSPPTLKVKEIPRSRGESKEAMCKCLCQADTEDKKIVQVLGKRRLKTTPKPGNDQ